MKVGIQFGAMCDSIKKQLAAQGLSSTPNRLRIWQRQADAVAYLSIVSLIPENAVATARRKILRSMVKHIRPLERSSNA